MGRETASAREGGRRQRSSPTRDCSGHDMVKVCQRKPVARKQRSAGLHVDLHRHHREEPRAVSDSGEHIGGDMPQCVVGIAGVAVEEYLQYADDPVRELAGRVGCGILFHLASC